jgi:hypothetical protein
MPSVVPLNFHFVSRHFHSKKDVEPLAFSLVESSISFSGREIFQEEKAN